MENKEKEMKKKVRVKFLEKKLMTYLSKLYALNKNFLRGIESKLTEDFDEYFINRQRVYLSFVRCYDCLAREGMHSRGFLEKKKEYLELILHTDKQITLEVMGHLKELGQGIRRINDIDQYAQYMR